MKKDKINYYIIFDYSPYGLLENILKKKKKNFQKIKQK